MAVFIQHVAAKVRHGPFLSVKTGAPISLCRWLSPTRYRPYNRSLTTVQSVPNCSKQNIVGYERFEQVLAPTRN